MAAMNRMAPTAVMVLACASCGAPQSRSTSTPATPAHVSVPEDLATRQLILDDTATFGFSAGLPRSVSVTPTGDAVLFLRSGPRSLAQDLYTVDTGTGAERVLVRAADLLGNASAKLGAKEKARRERMRMITRGISRYQLSKDGARILIPLAGKLYVVDRKSGAATKLAVSAGYPIDPMLSPDGEHIATTAGGNVQVIDIATRRSTQVSHCKGEAISCGEAEFVAQEEMGRFHGFWWSPDSRFVAFQKTDTSPVEVLYLANPRHPEKKPQPRRYPRAGTANAKVTLAVVPRAGGKPVWVAWDHDRYPYLANVVWEKGGPLTIVVESRAQTEVLVLAVDHETGKTRELLRETDDAWLNLDPDMPRWLEDGSGFLWVTERRGGPQLELHVPGGKLAGVLTETALGFRGVIDVNEKAHTALVAAAKDPCTTQVYRIALKAGGDPPAALTSTPGFHTRAVAKDHSVYVAYDSEERGLSPTFTVFRKDGKRVAELAKVAEPLPFLPNVERTRVTAGDLGFDAVLVRPRNFVAGIRYPVIVHVYGGPQHKQVIASFRRYLKDQWLADHGFIVVAIDGRGTPNRGRKWERATRGDFVRIPLADQKAALSALGARYPELDLARAGIYGWSFGGTMAAAAVMMMPETFAAAVAGAPVTDWHDYDTYYTERYLGLPAEHPEAYRVSSPITYADKLSRPLLLIHGTVDDNVLFLNSIELSDALFRAGKAHQFLPLSGFTHMVPEPEVAYRLAAATIQFFEDHLGDPVATGAAIDIAD